MRQIFRASIIIGSSIAVRIVAGIVKGKVVAVIAGPSGIGLLGLLQSVMSTSNIVTSFGLPTSGIRDIAEAHSQGDHARLSAIRNSLFLGLTLFGLIGAVIVFVFRAPIAQFVFDSEEFSGAIAWISLGVFAAAVSASQTTFLNGIRRLGDISRVDIIGSLAATVVTVAAVWFWGMNGVVAAVVAIPVATLAASTWFSRRVLTVKAGFDIRDASAHLCGMLGLGGAFMATALLTVACQFAVRLIITKSLGMDSTGQFQAAWSISMLYIGFVLNAMGADYYPRLASLSGDVPAVNKAVNEQFSASLLLAGPVILLTLALSAQVITLLYSGAFNEASQVLRWQALGDVFKVASWPIGFIFPAMGRGKIFFFTELAWNVIYISLVWVGINALGVEVTGISFLVSYVVIFPLYWYLAHKSDGFVLSRANLNLLGAFVICGIVIFGLGYAKGYLPLAAGVAIALAMGLYSLRMISKSLGGLSIRRLISGKG